MAPALALLLAPLVAHAPELLGWASSNPAFIVSGLGVLPGGSPLPALPGWIDPNAGFTVQALGGLAARDWLGGHAPWWNPYDGIGLPLAAEAQNGGMFLPFVLLLRLFDGVLYLKIAMQMAAGLAAWALLRQLGGSRWAAWLGGALFSLGGTFAWFAHAPILPIAFLPLLLLGIERARACARAGRPGGWAWVAVAVGWSILSGFPETAYIDGLLALAWAGLRIAQAARTARGLLARKLLAGGIAGLLIAAPLILPFAELLPLSYVGLHDLAAHFAMRPFVHALLLMPYVYGPLNAYGQADYGFVGGYVGLPTVLLAAMALLAATGLAGAARERALRLLLLGWVVATYGKAADLPGITAAANAVPLVAQTMFARLVQPSWQLACVVLAVLALDDWRSGAWRRPGLVPGLALAAVAAFAAVALALGLPLIRTLLRSEPQYPWVLAASLAWAGVTALAITLLCAATPTTRRAAGLGMVLVADALLMFMVPLSAGVRGARLDMKPVSFLRAHLGLGRFYTLGPFAPNYGALFETASINHNGTPTPRLWADHVRAALDPDVDDVNFVGSYPPGPGRLAALRRNLPAFEALGVRYVLALPGSHALEDRAPVFSSETLEIYELLNPAAYWRIEGGPCALVAAARQAVRAHCDGPATLIRRELFFPGWTATIDGRDAPISRAPPIFQAIPLAAGDSAVRFAYAPPHIAWAWLMCAAGLLMTAAVALRARLASR